MNKFRRILRIYLTVYITFLCVSNATSIVVAKSQTAGAKTVITATLPSRYSIRIFGYTAGDSIVQATASRVFAQTTSDRKGYFVFKEIPISTEAKELCLTTIDSLRRVGFPTCINLPTETGVYSIGPVLLSPTISISKTTIWQNDIAIASGKTIPNQKVEVSFFEDTLSSTPISFRNDIQHVVFPITYAKDINKYTITSDERGEYSIGLQTDDASKYRLFSKTQYKEQPSPKSQTISYSVGSFSEYFLRFILPWIIIAFAFVIILIAIIVFEVKTHLIRDTLSDIIETKLKPLAVRRFVKLKRVWYNFRGLLK